MKEGSSNNYWILKSVTTIKQKKAIFSCTNTEQNFKNQMKCKIHLFQDMNG